MPFDLESNTSSLASMLEIDMPSNHVEISTSKMVAITYDQVTWTLRVSQDQEILLRPALGTFPSWLSQQLTVGNSLTDISKPFTIALAFLDLLLELGVEQNILVPVLHNFEEDFLVDRDIHELVLTLPASASTRALERYFAASNMSTHTSPLSKSALLEAAAAGETNICAVFGGQGPSNSACLQDLRDINRIYGMHVDRLVSMTAQTIKQLVVLSETFHYYEYQGFDIERWLQDYSSTPDPAYIASAPVSFPLVGLLGLCHYCIACKITGRHPGEMGKLLCGVTGHSQGVIIAAVIARSSSWADYYEFAQEAIKLLFWIGFESHHESPTSCLSDAAINDCVEAGEGRPTPMLKILGLDRCAVSKLVDDVNTHLTASEHIHLALVNSRDNMVVAGPTRSLRGLNLRLRRIKAGGNLDQSRVPFSERKPVVRSQFLPISGAFHSPALRNVAARILRRFPSMTLCGSDLNIPLYHTGTGEDLKERGLQDILHLMVQMVTTEPVDWPRAISFPRVSYIVDFGPGRTGYLIQEMIQGSGVHVIVASDLVSLSNQVGPKAELFAHTLPAAGPNWQQEYRPKLVKKASGEIVLDTKISRLFGCPPLMVAGMTPTTVPWEFVAAVMKAGYHVELAGGGYVYAADFERAIQRTSQETVTGCSITCNVSQASFSFCADAGKPSR